MVYVKRLIVSLWGLGSVAVTGYVLSSLVSSGEGVHIPLVLLAGGASAIGGVLFLEHLFGAHKVHQDRAISFEFEMTMLVQRVAPGTSSMISRAIDLDFRQKELCAYLVRPLVSVVRQSPSVSFFESPVR